MLSAGPFPPDWQQDLTTRFGSRAPVTVHIQTRAITTSPSLQPQQLLPLRLLHRMVGKFGTGTLLMRSPGADTGSPGSTVKIVLLKGGSEVSTIASSVPLGSGGKGSYSWIVPTTLLSANDYKVSVQSISQTTIKDTSNANFIICWP